MKGNSCPCPRERGQRGQKFLLSHGLGTPISDAKYFGMFTKTLKWPISARIFPHKTASTRPDCILYPICARSVESKNHNRHSPIVFWRVFGELCQHLRQVYPSFASSNGEPILLQKIWSESLASKMSLFT